MATCAKFKCDQCNFKSFLYLTQPDRLMRGFVQQYYCIKKHKIATIFLSIEELQEIEAETFLTNKPETICFECLRNQDTTLSQKSPRVLNWKKRHPECCDSHLIQLKPFMKNESIHYKCPKEGCHGTMSYEENNLRMAD